jgi:uncharacterized protein (DUF1778 family)
MSRRDERLAIRVNEAERDLVKLAAKIDGRTESAWMRLTIVQAARRRVAVEPSEEE